MIEQFYSDQYFRQSLKDNRGWSMLSVAYPNNLKDEKQLLNDIDRRRHVLIKHRDTYSYVLVKDIFRKC